MAVVSGTFIAVGESAVLRLATSKEVDFSLSGTYAGTFYLEKATSPAELAWERIGSLYKTADATIKGRYKTGANDSLRWKCFAYTSGTATYVLDDNDDAATSVKEETLVVGTPTEQRKMIDLLEDLVTEAKLSNIVLVEGLSIKDELNRLRADIQTENRNV